MNLLENSAGFLVGVALLLAPGCAIVSGARVEAVPRPAPTARGPLAALPAPPEAPVAPPASEPETATAKTVVAAAKTSADDDADEADDGTAGDVGELLEEPSAQHPDGPLYTSDLSDETLKQEWKSDLKSLGSISVGFVDAGRLINAVPMPKDPRWKIVSPAATYGTQETINYVIAAISKVNEEYPNSPPLRVNQISGPEGGWLRPHKSHQNGRDVDLAFYYPGPDPICVREREKVIDVPRNWALVKALITQTDVQMILLDRHVQKVLYEYALKSGEDKAWLDSLFHAGYHSLFRHVRHHRDHYHVRFYNARAQELGRRVAPLLALQPEQNLVMHKVRRGDTLGALAVRFNSTVRSIQRANHMRNTFLSLGRVLRIPIHGACTHCPIPPPVVVPPRRLPPGWTDHPHVAEAPPVSPAALGGQLPRWISSIR